LPHFDRREILVSGAALATATYHNTVASAASAVAAGEEQSRSVASIQSHLAIPVWPSWGGGRVVPISLGGAGDDPFLLLAHHKHWFDPKDPLRKPFQEAGKALGLPYVDVEGFALHPHRGLDILTYVLDGSDGFCHKDSLGGNRIYRGGCAQWMRTGAGVMHEEFWETRDDRRTSIELFQLWINLPAGQKMDPPAVRYVGDSTNTPWTEETLPTGVRVRDISQTLDVASTSASPDNDDDDVVRPRPPVQIQHVQIPAGATWEPSIPRRHSALMYVREGVATVGVGEQQQYVNALQSATFHSDGNTVRLRNTQPRQKQMLDVLLLSGQPLREPVALGGPIVMNTEQELYDAYQQLSDGTFLDRDVALRQQAVTNKRTGYSN
jgi:redox-sensitive bicupin YhaK (pirin superfamily)